MPCPMRCAPNWWIAMQMLVGPVNSPACTVMPRPAAGGLATGGLKSAGGGGPGWWARQGAAARAGGGAGARFPGGDEVRVSVESESGGALMPLYATGDRGANHRPLRTSQPPFRRYNG